MIELTKELSGKILDIGGGGDGVIGRLYRSQVVAIDNCQEELDEAPDGFEKLLMDATDLKFDDASFDHVTFFFSLMFMQTEEQRNAILEAARVLRNGGEVHIWDCDIVSAHPEPFCVDVEVKLPDEQIRATYGIGKLDTQSKETITELCVNVGLEAVCHSDAGNSFYLKFVKK